MTEAVFTASSRLSHAYIVSAPTQEDSLRHAGRIAAAAVCSSAVRPCGQCRNCRKAEAGIHPDIRLVARLVDDKGVEKKNILVDQMRELALDAVVLPNEAEGKAYIIRDADTMNENAQNAALKLFEEPPKGVVFILCVTNPASLLPTVRSRCVELSYGGGMPKSDEQSQKLAEGFMKALATGKDSVLFSWCAKNEGLDTRQCAAFLDALEERASDILCGRCSGDGLGVNALMHLVSLISRCRGYGRVNVGTKHIFGLLAVCSAPEAETEDK